MKPFRILVTGSRRWTNTKLLAETLTKAIKDHYPNVVIVHGGCPRGADALTELFAQHNNIPTEVHPAKWKTHGTKAGPIRNQEMVDAGADLCIGFIVGPSFGTKHCVKAAQKAGIPTTTIKIEATIPLI